MSTTPSSLRLHDFLCQQCAGHRAVILDGGLATELERRGAVLDTCLWSAAMLVDDPDAVRGVHAAFFKHGADIVTTASYQLSRQGVVNAGRGTAEDADRLLQRSVALADAARTSAVAVDGKPRFVAASMGPYGGCLADGSEYTGWYGLADAGAAGVSSDDLAAFHRPRVEVLAATPGTDALAFETIPCQREAVAIAKLLAEEFPTVPAWISLSCRDGSTLVSGEGLADTVAAVERVASSSSSLLALGVNCCSPDIVTAAIATIRGVPSATRADGDATKAGGGYVRRVVVYANRGEVYDVTTRSWRGGEPWRLLSPLHTHA